MLLRQGRKAPVVVLQQRAGLLAGPLRGLLSLDRDHEEEAALCVACPSHSGAQRFSRGRGHHIDLEGLRLQSVATGSRERRYHRQAVGVQRLGARSPGREETHRARLEDLATANDASEQGTHGTAS